ncbi:FUSC family protein [Pseudomonas sp. NPDC008258]|uniref:FUSC family protein n=1 Tax=Pseudomonas sp. NPDC008258 TaxID=3364418 RepID=UPI0036E9903C
MKLSVVAPVTPGELLFSAKVFASAMLAMYVANSCGLPRPFWAMLTCYIIANPLAGAVRSKAFYRILGTLLGCLAAMLIVPSLINSPLLLTLALAAWLGICLYLSVLDRTPRSYIFMLAGYTIALISFPVVEHQELLFDTAVARVEEICIGICCATLVHSLLLPRSVAPGIKGLLDRCMADAGQWMQHALAGDADSAQAGRDRHKVAADLTQLRLVAAHLPFDTSHLRQTVALLGSLQARLANMLPLFMAVEDALRALQAGAQLSADVQGALAQASAWLRSPADDAGFQKVLEALERLAEKGAGEWGWSDALQVMLAVRLSALLTEWQACRRLRALIEHSQDGSAESPSNALLERHPLHRDHGLAALSGLTAAVAVCACSALWIVTAWQDGWAAPMMTAMFCSFFATLDDPAPVIRRFLRYWLYFLPAAALYVLVLMPLVQDFGMLVLICAPAFLWCGVCLSRPPQALLAMAMLFSVGGTLALHDTDTANMAAFANSMIAQFVGVLAAVLVTRLLRSLNASWSVWRIELAAWKELAAMASARGRVAFSQTFTVRMLDRVGLVAQRVALASGRAGDLLIDLRVGHEIAALQQVRGQLPEPLVTSIFDGLQQFFLQMRHGPAEPSQALRLNIERLLQHLSSGYGHYGGRLAAIAALAGLRRALFADVAGFSSPLNTELRDDR